MIRFAAIMMHANLMVIMSWNVYPLFIKEMTEKLKTNFPNKKIRISFPCVKVAILSDSEKDGEEISVNTLVTYGRCDNKAIYALSQK